jgi:hypothetical protein
MGDLNHLPPITLTRHDILPAQPGWFMIEWEGDHTNPTISKRPIIAWSIETEFWKQTQYNQETRRSEETGGQDQFSTAHPISPTGVVIEEGEIALGPDGCVYQLDRMGLHWPDIPSYVKWSWDQIIEQEEADKRRQQARLKQEAAAST